MKPITLFRKLLSEEKEFQIASSILPTCGSRMEIPRGSLVIGRYSVLPFYQELEEDLGKSGSLLINTLAEHEYIADVLSWSMGGCALHGLTPRTWNDWSNLPENASFVLKGKTNSKKHYWNTHMFAQTKADVPIIASRLLDDRLISDQGIVVREYIPLKEFAIGINGLPITNEWRTFWLRDGKGAVHLLSKGFYWASHPEWAKYASWNSDAEELAREAASKIAEYATFFVLDLAETKEGSWTVIEVNDGQMSGLSGASPEDLYRGLAKFL